MSSKRRTHIPLQCKTSAKLSKLLHTKQWLQETSQNIEDMQNVLEELEKKQGD
jgi:hypothetical protein